MQLVNIRPVSQYVPGDLTEVPDGAAFDEFHWAPAAPVLPAAAVAVAIAGTPLGRALATDDARAAEGLPPLATDPKEM